MHPGDTSIRQAEEFGVHSATGPDAEINQGNDCAQDECDYRQPKGVGRLDFQFLMDVEEHVEPDAGCQRYCSADAQRFSYPQTFGAH
jgi:hypothetical protein